MFVLLLAVAWMLLFLLEDGSINNLHDNSECKCIYMYADNSNPKLQLRVATELNI